MVAGLGQGDSLGTARDQRLGQLGFEAGQMVADRGLRDMKVFRGARQAAGLDDPNEISQLPKVHSYPRLWKPAARVRAARPVWRASSVHQVLRPPNLLYELARTAAIPEARLELYMSAGFRQRRAD